MLQLTRTVSAIYRLTVCFALPLNQSHRHICWVFLSGLRNLPASITVIIFLQRHQQVEQFWSLTLLLAKIP